MGPLGGDDLGRRTLGGRSMAWCSRRAVAGGVRRAGSGKETGRGRQCARLRLAGAEAPSTPSPVHGYWQAVRRSWVLVGSKIRIDAKEQSRIGLPFPIISGQ
uniref:Uncharacterized protein n=1 Tax=Oryza nivara TaxID=4536 RepID=A0A0E0J0L6_ORYNI